MLVRSTQLSDTMSRYLIRRIEENPKIELHYQTEIISVDGDDHLERVTWRVQEGRAGISTHNVRHLFIMTGASPRTEWLRGCLALDSKGFVLTGYDLDRVTLAADGVAALAPAADSGDQPPRSLRGWRYSLRKREARGFGGGRRLNRHSPGASSAGGAVARGIRAKNNEHSPLELCPSFASKF